ncbi:flagellin, partial [Aureimonas sp. AU40]|uniref:flagellin n=1 Tax=Aureimonas sp. AU40 TaxID=1637747 RepID=UPI0007854E51
QVVASFSRDASGAVSIGTIGVDTSTVALFDASTAATAGGILDGKVSLKNQTTGRDLDLGTVNATGNTSVAGLTATAAGGVQGATGTAIAATGAGLGTAPAYSTATYTAGSLSGSTLVNGDTFTVTVTLSTGGTQTATATVGADTSNQGILDSIRTSLSGMTGFTYNTTAGGNLVLTNSTAGTANYQFGISGFSAHTATLAAATPVAGSAGTAAVVKSTAALTLADYAVGDTVRVTLNIDGTDKTVTTGPLTAASGTLALTDIATALNQVLGSSATASVPTSGGDSGKLIFTSPTNALRTSFSIKEFVLTSSAGALKTPSTGGLPTAAAATQASAAFSSVTLDNDDHMYFNVQVGTATAGTNVSIDKALIDSTLKNVAGHISGNIASSAQFKLVLDAALKKANITNLNVLDNSGSVTFSTADVGTAAKLSISNIAASAGGDQISIKTIDISASGLANAGATTSDQIKQVLAAYIDAVNTAINKVTSAAASLGSVASRIDMQKSFVNTLMDTIDKGVSNLVDADMSEESTKLQALQVKQQLGTQALSIANQSAQSVLSL